MNWMNWFGKKESASCPDGPREWIRLADADIKRVHGSIYKKLGFWPHGIRGILDTDCTYKEYARGRSRDILIEDGFAAFKASYCDAEAGMFKAIKELMAPGDEVIVEFFCSKNFEADMQAYFSWVLKRKMS